MAYYTALINAWNSVTQPPAGVTGTGLSGGMTTAQKLVAVNGWTVSNVPNSTWFATAQQVAECIVMSEYTALSQANRMEILAMLAITFPLPGGSTSFMGEIAVLMPNSTCPLTYAKLVALAQTVAGSSPWWQVNGYTSEFDVSDAAAAGLS